MKKLLVVFFPIALFALATFGHGSNSNEPIVRWHGIAGVITVPGVDNPVGTIHGGATAWTVQDGRASVNLANGATFFEVDGLVINGTNSTGTPGPITEVTGTLVCNPGPTPTIIDTAAVSLDAHGDAHFSGHLTGVPSTCDNPLFLVRIAAPAGAAGRWIATGTQRFIESER
jgi:hypothetical protein